MRVWLRVGARTERLGAQSSLRLSHPTVSSNHPLLYSFPSRPRPVMKLQSSQNPHPRHFQYRRQRQRPCALGTSVKRGTASRSFGTQHLELCSPSWRSLAILFHIFIYLLSIFTGACFFFPEFNPTATCHEALVESGIS